MDNIIKTITSLLPLAIFPLGVVMWIFIVRWERKMNWFIDNTITMEDIPAMRLRRVSDDESLNTFMDRKELGEDDPSWNSILCMNDDDGNSIQCMYDNDGN